MQPSLFDDQLRIGEIAEADVASALACNALLLTSTSNLAIDWKRRLISASNRPVVTTPRVSGWQAWISELVAAEASLPVPLNRMQESELWEQVIRDDLSDSSQTASSIRGLARHARDAYAIMREQGIALSELQFAGAEAEALCRWIKGLQKRLNEDELNGRMLAADLPDLLLPMIADLNRYESLIVDGFEAFTPGQQRLLQALLQQGVCLAAVKPASAGQTVSTVTLCPDESAEFYHLGCSIAELLRRDPGASIAVVTSDSITDSAPLARALKRALLPDAIDDPASIRQAVTMQGERLADLPMIEQLLFMLGLAGKSSVGFRDLSCLIFSPWLKGYEQERFARAELDRELRRQNRHYLSLPLLIESPLLGTVPEFAALLKPLMAWKEGRASAGEWVRRVERLLQDSGFLPTGFEDSPRCNNEIRQLNSFRDILASLVALDAVTTSMSWSRFLSILRSACGETNLGSQAAFPNVVVMPLEQLVGLRFDHVFVVGLDEHSFPLKARPLPLLPQAVQQKYRIRTSSAPLAFERSTFLWQQLLASAPHVEISCAELRDEQEARLSPFARHCTIKAMSGQVHACGEEMALEPYEDALPVALQQGEKRSGGTALIRDQSACPFKAFARHRLGISELGESVPGIEPTTKGSLLHLALEYIWKRLQSAEQLHRLDDAGCLALIDEAIAFAWQKVRASVPGNLQQIEIRRMRELLTEWLLLERERPPFQVLSVEKSYRLQLPQHEARSFTVHITADRIDRDAEGRRILIDYKTGAKQSVNKWIGERIEEPQLPLYAMAAELGENDAVCFARVRSGEVGFEGLSGEEVGIKGVTPCDGKRGVPEDWTELLLSWREHLNALAAEFAQGRSQASPRGTQACRYCGLEPLCRIEESGFDMDAEEES